MREEIWIDGFNLFHRWDETRDGFRGAPDIGRAIDRRLLLLAGALGPRRRRATVFLDGGLQAGGETRHGLRVRSAGPGDKADGAMLEALEARGAGARRVTAVSDDRALGAALRARGAEICGVDEFAAWLSAQPPERRAPPPERELAPDEVEAWLKVFEAPR